jgi:2-isopropylmalate synthase
MRVDGEERSDHGSGDGMVDACYKVISTIVGEQPKLERYLVNAITGGTEAQGEVSCLIRDGEHSATGQGVHTDIIMASAMAYINALNKLENRRRHYGRSSGKGP